MWLMCEYFCLFYWILCLSITIAYTNADLPLIRKLKPEDMRNIVDACSPASTSVNSNIVNRVTNGKNAGIGQFPFAVVFVDTHQRAPFCGGTLISPRHVITARHCVQSLVPMGGNFGAKDFFLYGGGVCALMGTNCEEGAEKSMVLLDYDAILYDDSMQHAKDHRISYDLAIIQLTNDIVPSPHLHYACFRQSVKFPDEWLTIQGWGDIDRCGFDPMPDILQYAEGFQAITIDELLEKDVFISTLEDKSRIFATIHEKNPLTNTLGGDSGSGWVRKLQEGDGETKANIFELVGVHSSGFTLKTEQIAVAVLTSKYHEELCYYVGLCFPGVTPRANYLKMNRIVFRKSSIPSIPQLNFAPLRRVTDLEKEEINRCRWPHAINGPFPKVDLMWAAGITVNKAFVCGASFISRTHLITSASCIQGQFTKRNEKNEVVRVNPIFELFVSGSYASNGNFYTVSEYRSVPVQMIAWADEFSSKLDDGFSLVQISSDVRNELNTILRNFQPVCLPMNSYVKEDYKVFVIRYKQPSDLEWRTMDILTDAQAATFMRTCPKCVKDGVSCLQVNDLTQMPDGMNVDEYLAQLPSMDEGSGVILQHKNREFVGILLETITRKNDKCNGFAFVLDVNTVLEDICLYAGVCGDSSEFLNARYPFFNRVYRNNGMDPDIL